MHVFAAVEWLRRFYEYQGTPAPLKTAIETLFQDNLRLRKTVSGWYEKGDYADERDQIDILDPHWLAREKLLGRIPHDFWLD